MKYFENSTTCLEQFDIIRSSWPLYDIVEKSSRADNISFSLAASWATSCASGLAAPHREEVRVVQDMVVRESNADEEPRAVPAESTNNSCNAKNLSLAFTSHAGTPVARPCVKFRHDCYAFFKCDGSENN